jgi:hypothetical protein
MTDLVFEDPPKKSRRSEHWEYLLAVKEHPATPTSSGWTRFRGADTMTERLATGLASTLRAAASRLGGGWEITARMVAGSVNYGVWVRYVAPAIDEPQNDAPAINAAIDAAPTIPTVLIKRTPPKLPPEPEFHDGNPEDDPGAWLDQYTG